MVWRSVREEEVPGRFRSPGADSTIGRLRSTRPRPLLPPVMPTGLRPVPADLHVAPATTMGAAAIDEQPAAAFRGALSDQPRLFRGEQVAGRTRTAPRTRRTRPRPTRHAGSAAPRRDPCSVVPAPICPGSGPQPARRRSGRDVRGAGSRAGRKHPRPGDGGRPRATGWRSPSMGGPRPGPRPRRTSAVARCRPRASPRGKTADRRSCSRNRGTAPRPRNRRPAGSPRPVPCRQYNPPERLDRLSGSRYYNQYTD